MKRKRGGQRGNQNVRTHGFYSSDLSPAQISEFWHIITTEKVDPQFAIMRIKLRLLLQQEPVNRRVLRDAARLMARRESSRSMLSKAETDDMSRALFAALESQIPGQPEDLNK
ncbi:MAG: hypothetical protein A2Z28_02115 [Chloroflexi bacterium RBG_16_51_9]|nr:MAG: hypothetical protein A2Z28_02115 [Chloroflexi bacterium RBG_16_51_9]